LAVWSIALVLAAEGFGAELVRRKRIERATSRPRRC
jgi:hypothetical protein